MQKMEGSYLSYLILLRQNKRKKTQKKTNHKEKKMQRKDEDYLFFSSHFYIWDERLLLPSPLHVPATIISPPSSSLVSHISWKLSAIQA